MKPIILLFTLASALVADPTIIFIGDPHLNLAGQNTLALQSNWISDHKDAWDIRAVLCSGDWIWGNHAQAWDHGWSTIDAMGVPYLSTDGNHDGENDDGGGGAGTAAERNTVTFDAQIGYSRISGKPWFGGVYPYTSPHNSNANEYIRFSIGRRKFLVISLEIYPRPDAAAWASGVVDANRDSEVIVLTHAYMAGDSMGAGGSLFTLAMDTFSSYLLPSDNYSGTDIEAWAVKYPNIRHVICGHADPPYYFRRTDGTLTGIMADTQSDSVGGRSQTITALSFGATSVTVSHINTTTGVVSGSTDTFTWTPLSPPGYSGTAR